MVEGKVRHGDSILQLDSSGTRDGDGVAKTHVLEAEAEDRGGRFP